MSYSIKTILHHAPDKEGKHKIQILIIYKRMKFTLATEYKVSREQFNNGRCSGFKNANLVNNNLVALKDKYEKLLLQAIPNNPGKDDLRELFNGKEEPEQYKYLSHYIIDLRTQLIGKLSNGRIKHFKTLAKQIKDFGDIELKNVNRVTATAFEKYLRSIGMSNNTINTKMKLFINAVNHANNEKLVPDHCLKGYKKPVYIDQIPDYLTEQEIENFKAVVDAAQVKRYKTAGYYFLLSCYAGYRISDLMKFNQGAIRNDSVIIRAKKNKEIVAIPIYPKLAEILDKIKDLPFYFTEQSMRKYVKELAMLAGLARKIKIHTARHTFAMLLKFKGFELDAIAELLGDSKDIARIYARINNKYLSKEFKEKMG